MTLSLPCHLAGTRVPRQPKGAREVDSDYDDWSEDEDEADEAFWWDEEARGERRCDLEERRCDLADYMQGLATGPGGVGGVGHREAAGGSGGGWEAKMLDGAALESLSDEDALQVTEAEGWWVRVVVTEGYG